MLRTYFSLVTFSHTIFAMPFAMIGGFLGFKEVERLDWLLLFLVVGCMVTARNAAMGFNRYLDRDIDAANERTQIRDIPAGRISPSNALIFVIINCLLFILLTYFINSLCFYLSPVALFVVLGYSYTKRFTSWCHLVLGLGLGLAPVGSYLAVTGYFSSYIILLGFAVLFWVSGFDIIYALQDADFDKKQGLFSIPSRLGKSKALRVSEVLHMACAGLIAVFGYLTQAGWLYWIASMIFAGLLVYQHRLVSPNDLSKVNRAFFTTNGIGSLIFGCLVIIDIVLY